MLALPYSPVNLPTQQYFALIVPICALLQGLALVGCWTAMRGQRYLLWVAASYALSAIPLAAHSLMLTSQLADWAVLTGVFYLVAVWCASRGMAEKYGGTAHPRLATIIILATLGLLYYFSAVVDDLWIRMLCLNCGLTLLLVLPVKSVFQAKTSSILLERILRYSFLLLVAYAFVRTASVYFVIPREFNGEFTRSGYWLMMLGMSLVISLWFTFVLLACVMREIFQTLKNERNQDPLTHLLNRRAFFEMAGQKLGITTGASWALIMCDIDHFKRVNDTWGHAAGDQVLEMIGKTLLQQVRPGDLVARFGGEEFVIMLKCKDIVVAQAIAERMLSEIRQTKFPAISEQLTASFGVSLIDTGRQLANAIEEADGLLYQAKRTGRNRVEIEKKSA
jgi:diguanylate cyclase (GGDEF)-like protein